ncbi:MAG: AAA family ATPase [Macellibacteroides fermentans]|uniref:AAA family ATPase n=1 Tax=Macellibacteroides fermentans TaxID=879969 RepID=UPI003AC37B10
MGKIKIKNFGPIKDGLLENDGWIDINKVTFFIGNQGSGKSTIAKLISTFAWIEKALVRGDYDKKWFERQGINRFKSQFLPYHRLDSYLKPDSVIEYQGEAYSIKYLNESLTISEISNGSYSLPQIMYVPAERNFLTYIKGAKELKLSSEALQEFNTEYYNAQQNMRGAVQLPINNTVIEYDKLNDTLNLKGDSYKVKITDASSGFQSFVPLYLVSDYLANRVKLHTENKDSMSSEEEIRFKKGVQEIWSNDSLTDDQKRIAISALSTKFNKTAFINIVEEPEQNLFPSSQSQMLQSLLAINNMTAENKLIVTTHSPYLINYLTIAIKAKQVLDNLHDSNREALSFKIKELTTIDSCTNADEVLIYEMEDKTGLIKLLPKYNELIPSDNNFLNNMLAETNDLFVELQEIEEENED